MTALVIILKNMVTRDRYHKKGCYYYSYSRCHHQKLSLDWCKSRLVRYTNVYVVFSNALTVKSGPNHTANLSVGQKINPICQLINELTDWPRIKYSNFFAKYGRNPADHIYVYRPKIDENLEEFPIASIANLSYHASISIRNHFIILQVVFIKNTYHVRLFSGGQQRPISLSW